MEGAADRAHVGVSSHQALVCGEQGTKELHFLIFMPLLFSREHRLTLVQAGRQVCGAESWFQMLREWTECMNTQRPRILPARVGGQRPLK